MTLFKHNDVGRRNLISWAKWESLLCGLCPDIFFEVSQCKVYITFCESTVIKTPCCGIY